tara:strand:+ start:7554 stop:8219 length:666 start_codon:yes stop_codon:yes gene_type:complete
MVEDLNNIQVQADSFECSVTTDISVFAFIDGKLKILLTQRTIGNFIDSWMLPGGVMESNENLDNSAEKVLFAYTGFKNIHFEQVKAYSAIDRHPLKRVLTVSFYALIKPENHPIIQGENVSNIKWFGVKKLPKNLGFDHEKIISDSHIYLKNNLRDRLVVGELLPEKFTMNELQILYESILEEKLDKRNFRKRIFQMEILKNTGEIKPGIKGGPTLFTLQK